MNELTLFAEALEQADPQARAAFLERACQGDPALRERIDRLLAQHENASAFLESSPVQLEPTIDGPATERPDTVIGPYKLLEHIGEGGMGTVWMAQQTEPVKRVVAVKLIKAGMDSRQVIARFEAERQALALMDHVNIARVLDVGTTGAGRPYFVMDLVKGVPITKYCDEHHLTPRQRLELFIPVCQAVQHAHQKGIIHRDLKPSNVLVALYDGKPVPKVIDFGVAKATGQRLTDKTLVTGFGALVGTPEYMSPEQANINQLDIDTRSDIYSLGVLLYELLAGSPPFTRKDLEKAGMLEMLRVIREQEPSKPSTKLSTAEGLPTLAANRGTEPARLTKLVRGELDWIVMKALEKDRSHRYETANGFAMDVQRCLANEPVQACPPSAGYRFRKFARRNRGTLATVAVVSLALVLGTVVSTWQAVRARQAEENATKQRIVAQVQRRFARQAVDKMFTQVAEKWLSRNTSLESVQKQILMDALQIYEELAKEEVADPTLRLERGNAYRRIGEIHYKLGNAPESERAFRKAQEILGQLVEQHPSEPEYRSALGSSYHQYAFALHYSARMEDALEAYRQALLHRERLAADYPGVPRYTREMAVSLGGVANMLESCFGSFPEAESAYLRAVHLMEGLSREVADDPDCRFELGLLCSELSGIQLVLRGRESEQMFYRGKAVYEQLVSEFPHDPTYREELAWALRCEGMRLADRPDDQEKSLRRSLAINLQLAQESPTVPGYQASICVRSCELGSFLQRRSRRAEAEDLFRQSARRVEQLLSDFPDWRPACFDGAFISCHLAPQWLLLQDGRPKEAEAIYLRALEVYAHLKPRWMESPSNRWFLAEFRWYLAGLACQYGRREDAAQFSGEALSLYEQSAAELPRRLDYQKILAARKAELGNVSTCGEPAKQTGQ